MPYSNMGCLWPWSLVWPAWVCGCFHPCWPRKEKQSKSVEIFIFLPVAEVTCCLHYLSGSVRKKKIWEQTQSPHRIILGAHLLPGNVSHSAENGPWEKSTGQILLTPSICHCGKLLALVCQLSLLHGPSGVRPRLFSSLHPLCLDISLDTALFWSPMVSGRGRARHIQHFSPYLQSCF